jgi:hypothetical protein
MQMTIEDAIAANAPRCIVPDADTGCGRLLRALQRGMRPTIITAGPELGIGALSQRIGDLRRMGWPIRDRKVSGKSYVEYFLEAV